MHKGALDIPGASPLFAARMAALAQGLAPSDRRTLDALVRCILAGAPAADTTHGEVLERLEDRIRRLPPWRRRDLLLALRLLGSRWLVGVTIGRPVPFAALDAALAERCFARWGTSRLPALRTAHQAFRRLALAVHYALPPAWPAIGYAGPLHERAPVHPWEGPAAPREGIEPDAEPIARGTALPPARAVPRPAGVTEGREVTGDLALSADAVVIGTGAGGAVAAARLAEAGLDVVVLEEGGWYRGADFTERELEMTEALYADGGLRATDDLSLLLLQGRAVGGSTTVNWLIMLRTPDWVLDEWARDHGVEGCSPAELAPVFDRIEREVHAREVPDDAHSPNNRLLLDGARALGWRATGGKVNAIGCVRAGFCGLGCRWDAKQGTLQTYVPRALAAGARLFTDAAALRIERRERDGGRGRPPLKRVHARVLDRATGAPRHALTVDAPIVVVAGGAVGTPVLLQRSGLGGGGVGRWLRLHPTTAVLGFHDRPVVASAGLPLTAVCTEHLRTPASDYGFWIECPPLQPALGSAAAPGFGQGHAQLMRRFERMAAFIALTRDGAERTVSSGRVEAGRDGRVRIAYRLTPTDAATVRRSIAAAAELHLARGATEVRTLHARPTVVRDARDLARLATASVAPNDVGLFSAHVNGTCRMGTDPATSGTTPLGERHGVRGLFVADGSLLPTALGVNPQETIMALASVVADRIAAGWGGDR